MHRVLKPGGQALIIDPRRDAPIESINRLESDASLDTMTARFGSYVFRVAACVTCLEVPFAIEFVIDGHGALPILHRLALVS
jgi:SAM-dependent methyltransferase